MDAFRTGFVMSKIAMLAHFLRQKMATALPMMQII